MFPWYFATMLAILILLFTFFNFSSVSSGISRVSVVILIPQYNILCIGIQ